PIGWDDSVLDLAIANGAILSQLRQVEIETRCSVRPWVALEEDISSAITRVHGSAPTGELGGRLEQAQGDHARPPGRAQPPAFAGYGGRGPRARIGRPPAESPLERVGFYDAVEQLYEMETPRDIARMVGRALLNYFRRVVVLEGERVVGHAGVTPKFSRVEPDTRQLLDELRAPSMHYGETATIPRAAILAQDLHLGGAVFALIGTAREGLVYYADNESDSDAYEDLHDLALLFKEVETALALL
ncbi:MAG: hypothetical protein AAFQ82_25190, partial [Myxococcota bacterium]